MEPKYISISVGKRKEKSYVRASLVVAVTAIILLAGMTAIRPSSANAAEIHAAGSASTTIASPDVAQRTVGDLFIQDRLLVGAFTGGLEGKVSGHQTLSENTVDKKASGTTIATFTGTLAGSERGSFTYISMFTSDRSACPCPPGTITVHVTYAVVEGTGQGAFDGVCGTGTGDSTGNTAIGFTTTYDFKFRFGKDCKANN